MVIIRPVTDSKFNTFEVYGTKTAKVYFTGAESDCKRWITNARARHNRRAKNNTLRSLGLVKVKGALGGTYWE